MSINNNGYHSEETEQTTEKNNDLMVPWKHSENLKSTKSFSRWEMTIAEEKKLIKRKKIKSISDIEPKEESKR